MPTTIDQPLDDYADYRSRLAGKDEGRVAVHADVPQCGFYRVPKYKGGPLVPVAIWRDDATGTIVAVKDGVHVDPQSIWSWCANKEAVIDETVFRYYEEYHAWPDDAPPLKPLKTLTEAELFLPEDKPGPGHNSDDLEGFRALREQLLGDIAEAEAYLAKNSIKDKAEADKIENWRKRIAAAGKDADERRLAETKPMRDQVKEINARWDPLIGAAEKQAGIMKLRTDHWAKAETARLHKEAQDKAFAELQAIRRAAEAERARIEAERAEKLKNDPVAALTEDEPTLPDIIEVTAPVVVAPKVMLGTTGTRRSAKDAPATATIIDLGKVAAYYVSQQHPELVDLCQKLANKAAKAKATVPGVRMSWEK